jgi:hypothetical protein
MSQETPIGNLGGGGGNSMNQEDSRLVDSILNDLNSGGQGQQMQQQQMQQPQQHQQTPMGGQPPHKMSHEQHRQMLEHRQQQMMQQQMMQQQMMQQQMTEQQNQPESFIDKLQSEWKNILLVVVLSVLFNTGFVDSVFKMNENTYFIQDDGSLNIQASVIKALLIGSLYYLAKSALQT